MDTAAACDQVPQKPRFEISRMIVSERMALLGFILGWFDHTQLRQDLWRTSTFKKLCERISLRNLLSDLRYSDGGASSASPISLLPGITTQLIVKILWKTPQDTIRNLAPNDIEINLA